ncbi:hypothetical protein MTO96_022735 [Rhipicephalus appendiculatus]
MHGARPRGGTRLPAGPLNAAVQLDRTKPILGGPIPLSADAQLKFRPRKVVHRVPVLLSARRPLVQSALDPGDEALQPGDLGQVSLHQLRLRQLQLHDPSASSTSYMEMHTCNHGPTSNVVNIRNKLPICEEGPTCSACPPKSPCNQATGLCGGAGGGPMPPPPPLPQPPPPVPPRPQQSAAKSRALILKLHNEYRSRIAQGNVTGFKPAADMKEMLWDSDFQYVAQALANLCTPPDGDLKHDNVRDRFTPRFEQVDGPLHPARVGAKSRYVGCGYVYYTVDKARYAHMKMYACDYGPAGNYLRRPVCWEGSTCSACPAATQCDRRSGLCDGTSRDPDVTMPYLPPRTPGSSQIPTPLLDYQYSVVPFDLECNSTANDVPQY